MMWQYGWGMGGIWLFGLVTLIGIALLVVLLVRIFDGGTSRGAGEDQRSRGEAVEPAGSNRARQILDERFASGELSVDAYREQVRVLRESR